MNLTRPLPIYIGVANGLPLRYHSGAIVLPLCYPSWQHNGHLNGNTMELEQVISYDNTIATQW